MKMPAHFLLLSLFWKLVHVVKTTYTLIFNNVKYLCAFIYGIPQNRVIFYFILLKEMGAALVVFTPLTKMIRFLKAYLPIKSHQQSWHWINNFYKVKVFFYQVGSCYLMLCVHQIDFNLSWISKVLFLLTLRLLFIL